MRVSLVFPPLNTRNPSLPPVGVLRLAGALESVRHEVSVHDFVFEINAGQLPLGAAIYEECARRIRVGQPEVVGFHTQCASFPGVLRLARLLKEQDPTLTIVLGGAYASFVGADTLRQFPWIDFILGGEAEATFPALLEAIAERQDPAKVGNLHYRNGRVRATPSAALIADLDSLAPPAYHLVAPPEAYQRVNQALSPQDPMPVRVLVDDGRGCAYTCSFCTEHLVYDRRVRRRSPENILDEFRWLSETYGVRLFELCHDHFTHNRGQVVEFCDAMIRDGVKDRWGWMARCRVDRVDKELLDLMHRAGCVEILYGIESSSVRVREGVKKHLRRNDTNEMVRYTCEELGIKNHLTFITGFHEETPEDLEQTLEAILEFARFPSSRPFLHLASPLPGTAFHAEVRQHLTFRHIPYFSSGMEFDGERLLAEDERLVREHPALFSSFYNLDTSHLDLDFLYALHRGFVTLTKSKGDALRSLPSLLSVPLRDVLARWHEWHRAVVGDEPEHLSASLVLQSFQIYHDAIGAHLANAFLQVPRSPEPSVPFESLEASPMP